MTTNNESPITLDQVKCPRCGSDDETFILDCECCAECDNCGHRFMLED